MYKNFILGKKVVCFDLDGTIVNTNPLAILAFEKILKLANPELTVETVYGFTGEAISEKWTRLADSKFIKNNMTIKDLVDNTNREFLNLFNSSNLEPKNGFWDLFYTLKEDHGLKIALTTNTTKAVAIQVLNKLEIGEIFDFMIFGDDVKHKKPHPEIYLRVAKHFKVKPSEILVFEDSVGGAMAAHKAGCSLIVVWDGQTSESLYPYESLTFISDFKALSENLDYTAKETLENFKKQVSEWEQSQQTQK